MDRLTRGDRIAGIGGVVLFISLFLPWFRLTTGSSVIDDALADTFLGSLTAWQTFDWIDILLAAVGLGVVIALALIVTDRIDDRARTIFESVGGITALIILFNLFDKGKESVIGVRYGGYLALLAAVAIAVGGYFNRTDGVV